MIHDFQEVEVRFHFDRFTVTTNVDVPAHTDSLSTAIDLAINVLYEQGLVVDDFGEYTTDSRVTASVYAGRKGA